MRLTPSLSNLASASDPTADPKLLFELYKLGDPAIDQALAANTSTPFQILEELANRKAKDLNQIIANRQYVIKKTEIIAGKNISLRNVTLKDAAFILSLRTDNQLSKHISKVDGRLDSQITFIEKYKQSNSEAYFIICENNAEARKLGTVRLYDQKGNSFSWGSWILIPNRPKAYAVESAVLVYKYGFDKLGFMNAHFDVAKENTAVCRFHERFGAQIIDTDDKNNYYSISRKVWENNKSKYNRFLPTEI